MNFIRCIGLVGVTLCCCLGSVPGKYFEAHAADGAPPYAVAYSTPTGTGHDPAVIYAVRADGSDRVQLTSGDSVDRPASWSPDGSRLVFERIDSTRVYSSVVTVGLDGASPVVLGNSDYDELPAWSPDGRLVAYQEQTDYGTGGGRSDTSFDLWVVRPDGTSLRRLGTGGTDGSSAEWVGEGFGWDWSPDSKRIALVEPDPTNIDLESGEEGQRLAVLDVASSHVQARLKLSDSYPDAWDGWAWSPDGRRIAFIRPGAGTQIGVLDVKSRTVVGAARVAPREVVYQGPDKLPLGEYGIGWVWITATRLGVVQVDRAKPRNLRLATVDAVTGKVWQIPVTLSTRAVEQTSLVTQWTSSPNGRLIGLFTQRPGSSVPSFVVADAARHTTRVLGPGTSASWSPDGRRIAVVLATSDRTACGDLRIVPAQGGPTVRIPRPTRTCDGWPEWTNDGSALIFTRSRGGTETTFTVASDGSGLHALFPVPATEVSWPTGCAQLYWRAFAELLPDRTGALQLVRRPQLPPDSVEAWRCS